jgi:small subunit ribosomal protein S6
MKTYEGLFLLDAGNPDFEAAAAPVRQVLEHVKAEVLVLKLWDERRLAYEIAGRKRGLYVLTYFKVEPAQMASLEHEVQLNEQILRAHILTAEGVTTEQMNAPCPVGQGGERRWEDRREGDRREPARGFRPSAHAAAAQPAAQPAAQTPPSGEVPPAQPAPAPDAAAQAPAGGEPQQAE